MTLPELLVAASSKPLPGVFHTLEPTLRHYGYAAVGGVLFAENIGFPFPGETLLVAAALYAGTGRLNIWLVLLVSTAASIAGACVGYVVGARGGRPLVEKYGRFVFLPPPRLERVEAFFERRGALVIVLGRFIDGVRQLMSILVGISEMTFRRFLVFTSIGAVLWCSAWSGIGYFAGDHVETVSHYVTYIAIALAALVVLAVARHIWHARRAKASR